MARPPYKLRSDESGVSEVVGTLLILAMTVILFASIIIWVSSIPTPPATTKLDVEASYVPILLSGDGANLTLRHRGGEDLFPTDVRIYITIERNGLPSTSVLKTKGIYTSGPLNGKTYGLVDGNDAVWNIGERWQWSNYSALSTDKISATLVDLSRNVVLWSGTILGAPGSHPPIFLDKWADREWTTPSIDPVYTAAPFHILARMVDDDNDLISVTGVLTIFFGSPDSCKDPQALYDDGTRGDGVAGDGIWTLYRTCMDSPSLQWDGSIVLFNATDANGHYTNSRMTLRVLPNPSGAPGGGSGESGRPPNLRYNGQQGYNIFNATEWAANEFAAVPTRNFKANEQVVVVVGSLLLTDTRGQNQFTLYDQFSGIPAQPVVYGTTKTVTVTSRPSNSQAFAFTREVNNYLIFVYKFDLNSASVGTNYYTNPSHPPYYFFAQYPLSITLVDSSGMQFLASDAINITDLSGNKREFPLITTFADSVYTKKATLFQSTDTLYVQVSMLTVDGSNANLQFGNIVIRDFLGGTQVFKAPINGREANPPLCPVTAACNPGTNIFTVVGSPTIAYRFAINLSRADQDGWVDGRQSYSFTIASIRDADEQYSNLGTNFDVVAPLYRLDIAIGTDDATPPGTKEDFYGRIYFAINGIDRWRPQTLQEGLKTPAGTYVKAIKYIDFDGDADLDVVTSFVKWMQGASNNVVFLYRQDIDSFGNPVFYRFQLGAMSSTITTDIAVGDVTADGSPEVVAGGNDGKVWYFKNDGAWSRIDVDTTRTSPVNSVEVADFNGDGANDIAVGRSDGKVTYYLNLDKQGRFANIAATDDWFPTTDYTVTGTIASGSYLDTYVSDNVRESLQEQNVNEAVLTGSTVNPDFSAGTASWTGLDWEQPASATENWQSMNGNPGGYVDVNMAFVSGQRVSGYWYQPFEVTGAGPWSATLNLSYRIVQKGGLSSSITLYAFVDKTAAVPVPGSEIWSVATNSAGGWTTPAPINGGGRISGPGTYYLKVVARTLWNTGGSSTATIAGFDNVQLSWSSTAGPVSELRQYWRIQQLPNRPASTYTFNLEAQQSASSDGDTFTFAWSTGPVGNPPSDSLFVDAVNVSVTSDTLFSSNLPSTLGGQIVWVRVVDRNRIAGNVSLDTISVDKMYIHVVTSGGTTGSDITMPDVASVNAIDSGDQQGDGYADIVAGTSGGHVYKLLGSSGGLLAPSGAHWTTSGPTSISGIKWENGTVANAGLEIALTYGANALVITGSGSSGTAISAALGSIGGNTILALGAGDIDGDGDDDIVISTGGPGGNGSLRYWRNLGGSTSWASYDLEINIGAPIYDVDLGDMSNAAFIGR